MTFRTASLYPEPTWRLCHPVNIYVYKNGVASEKPQLVHIPMEKKKNMTTVLEAIGTRMKLPVGYPSALYNMDGTRVCKTYELEMYNNYVVVTNLEKSFKCVDYGKVREPLVVIGHHSKHVNTLKFQNKKYDLFCRRKMSRKPLHELATNADMPDGLSPSELSSGKPCGVLCHKIQPARTKPTQVYSDEIMCVEGAAMDQETDYCRQPADSRVHANGQMFPLCQEEELEELVRQVRRESDECRGSQSANLLDLMERYKVVGSDIFKMFQDRINQDTDSTISSRWNIPAQLDAEAQQKLKDDWTRLTNAPCDFTFDEFGNFLSSSGCRIGPPPDGVASNSKNNSPTKSGSLTLTSTGSQKKAAPAARAIKDESRNLDQDQDDEDELRNLDQDQDDEDESRNFYQDQDDEDELRNLDQDQDDENNEVLEIMKSIIYNTSMSPLPLNSMQQNQ